MPEIVDRHRAEGAGHALPCREQHVHLARVRVRRDLERVGDQPVGLLAPRTEHGDDAGAGLALGHDPLRCALEAPRVGDGGAAELHDHGPGHRAAMLDGRFRGPALVLAMAACAVATGCGDGGDSARALPEAGSRSASAARAGGRRPSLLDALAPVLAPAGGRTPPGLPAAPGRAAARLLLIGFAGTGPTPQVLGRLREREWGGVVLVNGNGTST